MAFDEELKNIGRLHTLAIAFDQETEKQLAEFDRTINEIRAATINAQIREKVDSVYDSVRKTTEKLISMEQILNCHKLSRAVVAAKPSFDEANFLEELRDNYLSYGRFVEKYCQRGIDSYEETINGLAQCHVNICRIAANLNNYLKQYIREDDKKREEEKKVNAERIAYMSKRNVSKGEQRKHALAQIKALKQDIEEYVAKVDEIAAFGEEPMVHGTFPEELSLVIGRKVVNDKRVENFPKFAESVTIPSLQIEEINLSSRDNSSNILIQYKAADSNSRELYNVIESIIVRFVQSYPAYFKNVCAIHQRLGSELIRIMGQISPKPDVRLLFTGKHPGVETSTDGIRNAISVLGQKLEERMGILPSSTKETIVGYNSENTDNVEPLTLIVIKDYPNGIDESTQMLLTQIMSNANVYGIYLLLICPDTENNELTKLCKNVYQFSDGNLVRNGVRIETTIGVEHLNNVYFSKLHEKFRAYTSSIRFTDINEDSPVHKLPFSSVLEIPIGKEGNSKISLKLEVQGPAAHAVISGTSGSGKSSLLQNIVLGGAWNYSPEELELWLLDFKDGTGFSNYGHLKHVRMMALKNKSKDAAELLNYLSDELHRRLDAIARTGGGDILSYNKIQKSKNQPLMPRLIVIIDEYTQMGRMHECINMLKNIAQQGRSAGISLVMCSQLYDSTFDETVSQANHRFEFTNNKLGRLIETDSQDPVFLSSLVGNALYTDGMGKRRIRVAYAGNTEEQNKLIARINEKYAAYKGKEPIIMGMPKMEIMPASSLQHDAKAVVAEYKKTRSVITPIGETRLGKITEYKINGENPLLFLFGDEARAANIEYSLLKKFSCLANDTPNVYYVDMLRSADREENVMRSMLLKGNAKIRFAGNHNEFAEVLKTLYKIYQERVDLLEKGKDVGVPLELVIHAADDLLSQLRKLCALDSKKRPIEQTDSFSSSRALAEFDSAISEMGDEDIDSMLESIGNDVGDYQSEPINAEEEEVDYPAVFRELFTNGKNYRIYFMLQFSDMRKFRDTQSGELYGGDPNLKDVVVIPKRHSEGEVVSYAQIVECLRAARQDQFAGLYDEIGSPDKSELEYAIIIDENQPTKVLPYEWSVAE